MGSVLLVTLVVFIIAAPTISLLLLSRRGNRPIQFSLRALFVALTIVALILGGVGWWRMANLAQVQWLDPASAEAIALLPSAEIVQNDEGEWSGTYFARCRRIHELTNILDADGVKIRGDQSAAWEREAGRIVLTCEDRESLEEYLDALKNADKRKPGEMVLRGRVEDAEGRPVAGATIDLMGRYVYINQFQTREDGTFVMPITPNEGWGYYLRIRPQNAERRNTRRFSLSYDEPERVVRVRVP